MESSKVFGKAKAQPHEVEYRSLSVEELKVAMNKEAEHIANVFEVDVRLPSSLLAQSVKPARWARHRITDVHLPTSSVPLSSSSDT